jgi:Subtilase family
MAHCKYKLKTGSMITIGIIDSGISRASITGEYDIDGVWLKKRLGTGSFYTQKDIGDRIGHGSECFRIISSIAPGAGYFIVKIFENELITDVEILAEAIQICVDRGVALINISAGIKASAMPELLRIACDRAADCDTVIIAAEHNDGSECYPADYYSVIGVAAAELGPEEQFRFVYGEDITFYASAADMFPTGTPWSLSTSFACARFTGYAAKIVSRKGRLKRADLIAELINDINQLTQ